LSSSTLAALNVRVRGDEPPSERGGIRDALDGRCVSPPEGGDEVQARTASDERERRIVTRLVRGCGHT
jgi:hypothetical protein